MANSTRIILGASNKANEIRQVLEQFVRARQNILYLREQMFAMRDAAASGAAQAAPLKTELGIQVYDETGFKPPSNTDLVEFYNMFDGLNTELQKTDGTANVADAIDEIIARLL